MPIDWAHEELVVRSKEGDGWARSPLPMDVGRALERYMTSWRGVSVAKFLKRTTIRSSPLRIRSVNFHYKCPWLPNVRKATMKGGEKVALENDRVRVIRVKIDHHEKHPVRDRHDRVLVWLTDAHEIRSEPNGKKEEIRRKAGEVH